MQILATPYDPWIQIYYHYYGGTYRVGIDAVWRMVLSWGSWQILMSGGCRATAGTERPLRSQWSSPLMSQCLALWRLDWQDQAESGLLVDQLEKGVLSIPSGRGSVRGHVGGVEDHDTLITCAMQCDWMGVDGGWTWTGACFMYPDPPKHCGDRIERSR